MLLQKEYWRRKNGDEAGLERTQKQRRIAKRDEKILCGQHDTKRLYLILLHDNSLKNCNFVYSRNH